MRWKYIISKTGSKFREMDSLNSCVWTMKGTLVNEQQGNILVN